jgi:DNA-binding GntR family transcriptional regulator
MYNPTPGKGLPLRRYVTARQMALEIIRERIISGHLKPGARLDVETLSQEIGISHIPIREALGALEAEGLVMISPHRSIRVADLTPEMLQEIYAIRLRLEPFAAGIGALRITEPELQEMERLLKRMRSLTEELENAEEDQEILELSRVNRTYHFVLYKASGLLRLCRILSVLWDDSQRYIMTYIQQRSWRSRALYEHEAIYNAVLQRDIAEVERLITVNLESTRDALLQMIKNNTRS